MVRYGVTVTRGGGVKFELQDRILPCNFRVHAYNTFAFMSRFIITAMMLFSLGWGGLCSYASEVRLPVLPEPVQIGQELLQTTNQLWFLLSAIRSKADADASSLRFLELTRKIHSLDEHLSSVEVDVSDERLMEMLELVRCRIVESYETLHDEFESLCRVHCYGSQPLLRVFRSVVDSGMFDVTGLPECTDGVEPLTENEERLEMVRLKRLVEPDRAVLDILSGVKDPGSATHAADELARISKRLKDLQPEQGVANRALMSGLTPSVREAGAPLEKLLWGIRNEIVRIAGLPGYEAEAYDHFSEVLGSVYQRLGETHSEWFDDVFDSSFRTDLDDAIQENISTTP